MFNVKLLPAESRYRMIYILVNISFLLFLLASVFSVFQYGFRSNYWTVDLETVAWAFNIFCPKDFRSKKAPVNVL